MSPCRLGWLMLSFAFLIQSSAAGSESIARVWDEQILSGIRIDKPNPPVNARNLYHLSVAMYDAWAAYDSVAVGYLFREKHTATDVAAARTEAISYAAYRLLRERYALSAAASNTLVALDAQMVALGYDTNNLSTDTSTPAGLGNTVYAAVSSYFLNDGAFQTNNYQDLPPSLGGYSPVNPPLPTGLPGDPYVIDVNSWQPLAITNAFDQHNYPASIVQVFVGSQWLAVRPFALQRSSPVKPWFDPGTQPHLNGVNQARFMSDVIDVLQRSGELDPDDGVTIDISPGAFGNNTLGANDGQGRPLNPVTGLPYAPNVVPRGDFGRVLAEFWADGPNSETPPGHWNVIANEVADDTNTVKRIGGAGLVVDDLEWDVKVYFALNAAVHDAACAAWALKRFYNGGRPIESIRYMGGKGQSSDPASPSYNNDGLPLMPGVVELVTTNTAAPGGRHAGLPVGRVVIYTWPGPPTNIATQHSAPKWMVTDYWLPYQKASFVTPSFPGYISGHSTFSRAAAEVLAAITGTPFFPGGMGTFTAPSNTFLKFESGPSQTVQLQWATYFDASDQAGISRLWGGIHVSSDDLTGRIIGSQSGQKVWTLASSYFDGSVLNTPLTMAVHPALNGTNVVQFNTLRGFYYHLQSTTDLTQPFADGPGSALQAVDSLAAISVSGAQAQGYYRVRCSLTP